jgi:hypothetical protein
MPGTLTITTLSDGTNSTSATNCISGSAKAWVNFNGVTTTSIRASYNVSSVTYNAAGDYTINFTVAMADANYATIGSVSPNYGVTAYYFYLNVVAATLTESVPTASSVRINGGNLTGGGSSKYICVGIFR